MAASLDRDIATIPGRPTTRLRHRAMGSPRAEREGDDRARLDALLGLGTSLLSADSRESVAETAVRHVRELVSADYVSLILFDKTDGHATVAAAFTGAERIRRSRWE